MKVNKGLKNWLSKWRMYVFIVVAISILFISSLVVSGLSLIGMISLTNPVIWYGLALVVGILIVVFGFIIMGYILLIIKPKGK